jgi:hypothetical protein
MNKERTNKNSSERVSGVGGRSKLGFECSRFQELVDLRNALHHQVFPSTSITTTFNNLPLSKPISHSREPLQNKIYALNSEESMLLHLETHHPFLIAVGSIPSRNGRKRRVLLTIYSGWCQVHQEDQGRRSRRACQEDNYTRSCQHKGKGHC